MSKGASLFSDDTQEKEYEMLCPEGKQMGEDPGTGSARQGYLGVVLLAGDRADLRAFLLRERTQEPFEL
ncbi:hypothetical protein [Thermus neutrinimicus]|uniref:hypothetical protein n=1 Tax=Thermus neutrinimicus TaxID=2908149 RepID=UPI001FA9B3DA|nr:hypothetical protein [Thermus neutrinimicus]